MMIIKNGLVFEENGTFVKRDLGVLPNHTIASEEELFSLASHKETEIIDAEGLYIIPGLVDVHIHGAMGHDFCDNSVEGLIEIATYLKQHGITSFCPTSMTLPAEDLTKIFGTILKVPNSPDMARIAGIHMEGPYISASKKGAQNESFIQSINTTMFSSLLEACNHQISIISIAPELPGAMEFIKHYHDQFSISLGHTTANYDIAKQAFDAGANHVTHLFNAMLPLHHRDPAVIGATSDSPHVTAELICDGIHLHPSIIRMIFTLFGDDRTILVSDAMRAAGMEDGMYELGGLEVTKNGKEATLKDGSLAGSVTNLYDCMKNAVSFGIPLESAVKAVTCNPAKCIRKDTSIGVIRPGNLADLVIMDKDLNLVQVL